MIQKIRTSKISKVLASYLAIQLIVQMVQPAQLYALTGGPSQPEFESFTPIGTSDMVNLSSGDFNYNIPVMDVGGYPLNLSYKSGITMDQEASWVGLGWNLNVGQINRQVRGIPDDFDGSKGDKMTYEDNTKTNVTVGLDVNINPQVIGLEKDGKKKFRNEENDNGLSKLGFSLQYNNYSGVSFKPTAGLTFSLNENVQVGGDLSLSASEGATLSPKASLSFKSKELDNKLINSISTNLGIGISFNSREGVSNLNVNASIDGNFNTAASEFKSFNFIDKNTKGLDNSIASGSSSISFSDQTFTPTKRNELKSTAFTFSLSVGPDIFGIDVEGGLTAHGSFQKLAKKYREIPVFGYDHTEKATDNDILDYNRENDVILTKNTAVLPLTNYTYDLYMINGQGIGGMFRPFRSQVGYVFDRSAKDINTSFKAGFEAEAGAGAHVGADAMYTKITSSTGIWNTSAKEAFQEEQNVSPLYQKSYYKMIGDLGVDREEELFDDKLHQNNPMSVALGGLDYKRNAISKYRVKSGPTQFSDRTLATDLHRKQRETPNTAIQRYTKEAWNKETRNYVDKPSIHLKAKNHHTVAMKILQSDGSTYIYGEPSYNTDKQEVSFAIEDKDIDCRSGLIGYKAGIENSRKNKSGLDHYYNNIQTPAYAYTYLLTEVRSSDYEDLTGNGLTDDDLGAYTKFVYETKDSNYKWRVPYEESKATYNEGFNSQKDDQKGNYIYGEKELKYIKSIETKTHIAVFDLSKRYDGKGVKDHNGGYDTTSGSMYKLNTIKLYSKPEYKELLAGNTNITPIKTAHFIYDYSLAPGINGALVNNKTTGDDTATNVLENQGGKLTLKKLFFTYRASDMGRYTPYQFDYGKYQVLGNDGAITISSDNNYPYNLKGYDMWGCYKPNLSGCRYQDPLTTAEFPYVEQENAALQHAYTSAWLLNNIQLPSGGKIALEYESDDYQYVQDQGAMQMFKVIGATQNATIDQINTEIDHGDLYDKNYLAVALPDTPDDNADFIRRYLGGKTDQPIYFRFLLNMTSKSLNTMKNRNEFDFVEGYFNIDASKQIQLKTDTTTSKTYAFIPMTLLEVKKGGAPINPISKSGLNFGRKHMNHTVYGNETNLSQQDVVEIAWELVGWISKIEEIGMNPNQILVDKDIARYFHNDKSWIRLYHPGKGKLGGGSRVKKVFMYDQWDEMVGQPGEAVYQSHYGQIYDYSLPNQGGSSGVAAFEPNGSKENPLVQPIYNKKGKDQLNNPQESSYTEKPIGRSLYPAANITYSRVTVKNLPRKNPDNAAQVLAKHATGSVVNEFYTSKNFPVKTSYTELIPGKNMFYDSNQDAFIEKLTTNVLKIKAKTHLTMSQGFVIETNDMDGKPKRQVVYNENGTEISSVDYKYNTDPADMRRLNNYLPVIDEDGKVAKKEIGTHYEVINDFRYANTKTDTYGANINTAVIPLPFLPAIPLVLPLYSKHENKLKLTTTTKVIHRPGIMVEKIARDLGAEVSTKNLAWDAETGQVLLTETINEYDQHYFNFNYPSYWMYQGMGLANKNIGVSGKLLASDDNPRFLMEGAADLTKIFHPGDELITTDVLDKIEKLWVIYVQPGELNLMDSNGYIINQACSPFVKSDLDFTLVRSGYRNQQMASMASVTSMVNPLVDTDNNGDWDSFSTSIYDYNISYTTNPKIVNASAVEYSDYWKPQEEMDLPNFPIVLNTLYDDINNGEVDALGNELNDINLIRTHSYGFNPYLYNVRGDWKAVRSYAYLTRRNANRADEEVSLQSEGFFGRFNSFYSNASGNLWKKNKNNWTFASQVSQYSPYGAELENKDALNRYSSAQYGYQYTLPVAVSSNSTYAEMGFDGFEDYDTTASTDTEKEIDHFSFADVLDQNLERTSDEAHTGQYSVEVKNGVTAKLERNLEACDYTTEEFDCINDEVPTHTGIMASGISEDNSPRDNEGFIYDYETITIDGGANRANQHINGLLETYFSLFENVEANALVYPTTDQLPPYDNNHQHDVNENIYEVNHNCDEPGNNGLPNVITESIKPVLLQLDDQGKSSLIMVIKVRESDCGTSPPGPFGNVPNNYRMRMALKLFDEIGKPIMISNSDGTSPSHFVVESWLQDL